MSEELHLSYSELYERLEGGIGRRVRQLAIQSRAMAMTAHSEFRGDFVTPSGMSETIAMLAVQDFLDLCFRHNIPGASEEPPH